MILYTCCRNSSVNLAISKLLFYWTDQGNLVGGNDIRVRKCLLDYRVHWQKILDFLYLVHTFTYYMSFALLLGLRQSSPSDPADA